MAKGIYKRGNIFWIRYAGLDGKTVYESSGSDKFKDANDKLIGRKNDIKDRKQPEITRIGNHTFKELSEKYNQWMEGRHRSADSKKYRINIILSHFGNLPLRHFNTLAIEQYQTNLINKWLKPAGVLFCAALWVQSGRDRRPASRSTRPYFYHPPQSAPYLEHDPEKLGSSGVGAGLLPRDLGVEAPEFLGVHLVGQDTHGRSSSIKSTGYGSK